MVKRRRPLVPKRGPRDYDAALRRPCPACGRVAGARCDMHGVSVHAARLLDPMLEKDLQRGVEHFFTRHGWTFFHRRDPDRHVEAARRRLDREGRGFPDLILRREGRIVIAELKRDGATLSDDQVEWLDDFARAGFETFAWATWHYMSGALDLVAKDYTHAHAAELVGRWKISEEIDV